MNKRLASPAYQGADRGGGGLASMAALAVVAAMVVFALSPEPDSARLGVWLLALLAAAGVFSIIAYAIGLLQFSAPEAAHPIAGKIADAFSEGLLVTASDNRIIYANDAYARLCGATDSSGLAPVERLFGGPPEVSEAVYRLAQAARAGRAHDEDIRLSPPLAGGGGSVGWYRIRVRPLELSENASAALWIVADTTRDRDRQENLFQELRHAVDFLDHAPAGFFSLEPGGAIRYVNKTLAGWLGHDLTAVGSGGLSISDIAGAAGAARLLSARGGPGEVRVERIELDLTRRDGRSVPVALLHGVAFGQDGRPGLSRTLVLKRVLSDAPGDDLRAAEARFARFFDSTPMAIATLGAKGRVVRSNSAFAKLLPCSLEAGAASEQPLLGCIASRDRLALRKAIEAAMGGAAHVEPVDATLDEGEGANARSARFFVSPNEDAGEKGAMIYALDTTEQRKLQEGFVQSQKMQAIGQLAGGVAHDFNNMLTAIIGYSDLLLASHRPTDPSFQDIMQIRQTANRAAGLTRQLLAFSRRQTLRPQVLQLNDVLSDLHVLLGRLVGEKTEIDVDLGRDLWLVNADLNQLEQAIINLVVNARDATPEQGGRVRLRAKNVAAADCAAFNEATLVPADYVLIEVEDNGCGIAPEVMEKIFEPFFTTKEVGKGTGLGLSMVFGIVKQSGGFVFVESEVGHGTVFRVFLPRYVADPKEIQEKAEAAKPAADYTGQGVVLLVEDETAVRAFAKRALVSRGYSVIEAASGVEALEAVEKSAGHVDLIISDVVMPEMDGPALFAELRKRGVTAKVVFVSGYAEEAFAKNLPEGDFGFLPKPFSLKQLIETVKANLG